MVWTGQIPDIFNRGHRAQQHPLDQCRQNYDQPRLQKALGMQAPAAIYLLCTNAR